jgi:hypothetical protein
MKRLIILISLLSSFAIPASAAVRKDVADMRRHGEKSATAHLSKTRMPIQVRRDDPYWHPCDYFSDYGENSCGD